MKGNHRKCSHNYDLNASWRLFNGMTTIYCKKNHLVANLFVDFGSYDKSQCLLDTLSYFNRVQTRNDNFELFHVWIINYVVCLLPMTFMHIMDSNSQPTP